MNRKLIELNKKIEISKGSAINLASNELKDIIKVIKPLENGRIILRGTARQIISQEEGLLNFLGPLLKNWFNFNENCTKVIS